MNQNRFEEPGDRGNGLGTTEEMARRKAAEMAAINGRAEDDVLSSGLDQVGPEFELHERDLYAMRSLQ